MRGFNWAVIVLGVCFASSRLRFAQTIQGPRTTSPKPHLLLRLIVRVLVVDDFEKWRRYLCAMIQEIPGIQVVGEAADGFEAIQKTKNLRPDLILLDIGLPQLNGIEVARRLSEISPESKIIFVTENRSSDVMEELPRRGKCIRNKIKLRK